jgi:uncharacterized cupredoxin-like copper-binding protein
MHRVWTGSRVPRVFVAVVVMSTLLAACGGGSGSPSGGSSSSGQTVQVTEKEWQITVGSTTLNQGNGDAPLKAGSVTFDIKNVGTIQHAFEIQGQGIDQKTSNINPGASTTLTVTLKAGKYQVWCPIPGHKQAGMWGSVTAS